MSTVKRKNRTLLVRSSLAQLEESALEMMADGWEIDPDFKDPDSVKDVLIKLHGSSHDSSPAISTSVTMGMCRFEEVDLGKENAALRKRIVELEQELAEKND